MSNTVTLTESSVDTLIGTWTGLELWKAATENGTYSLVVQIPYVLHQTSYTYTDTSGTITDWYEVRRYGPGPVYSSFSSPWTISFPTPGRRSLQNTRRLLARALHSLTVVTTTSAGNATFTSLIASQLRTATTTDRYRHAWVMPVDGASAGEVRRVQAEDALSLTTGELTISPPFSAVLADGIEVEIHRLLPPVDDDGWTGLLTCLNDALRECWVPDRLAITGVEGQPSYSLSSYEDWLEPDAVLEIRRQALDATLNAPVAGTFDPVRNLDALTLQVSPTLPGGDASTLEVFRPLDTWIKVGGVWATSSSGFVNDSDEALINPDMLVTVALAHAYAALASGPDGSRYDDLAHRQRMKANVIKEMHLDHRQRRVGTGLYSGYGAVDSKSFQAMREEW